MSPVADRACGPYVWTVDGDRLTDYALGFGSVILGHADVDVAAAVAEELALDLAPTLIGRRQPELCQRLVDLVPGAEQVLLCRTGSDATDLAVRLARARTGRDHVLSIGYHGWHDWCAPRAAGIVGHGNAVTSVEMSDELLQLPAWPELACVVVTPERFDARERVRMLALRDFADRNGSLLIVDEVRSGFRVAMAGVQELFGLSADLAIYSKAMANGFAISAIVGKRKVFAALSKISSTSYAFRHTEAMAAALATITAIERRDALSVVKARGERMLDGLDAVAARSTLDVSVFGPPQMPFLSVAGDSELQEAFVSLALQEGQLLLPDHHWFVSAAHSDGDITASVAAIERALTTLATISEPSARPQPEIPSSDSP